MSVVSIHPEDLLDKLAGGELSGAERELLEAHLASCDVCRFELAVSIDFQNEARAVAKPSGLPLGTLQVGSARPPAERRRSRRVIVAIAAAMLIASTGAVASVTRLGRSLFGVLSSGDGELPPAGAPSAAPPVVAQSTPSPALDAAPASLAVSAPTPEPSSAPPSRQVALVSRPAAAASVDEAEGAESAEALFAEANSARRRGDLSEASSLYRQLQKTFPASQEAALSQVTLSMLLLERGDAAAALAGFDKYLARSRRPLEAEALVGRARALAALGSPSAEANAWREVQRKYPGSVYAKQAGDRLSSLGRP